MESFTIECVEIVMEMYREYRSSSQLRSTVLSVILNMMLTLTIWIGVYGMEKNTRMGEMYFLGSTANHTTGNQFVDGMVNGFGTILVLGIVSFIMLAFALFDFQRVVKAWLTTSCLLILYGVSGYTAYDFFERHVDISTEFGFYLTAFFVPLFSIIYGSFGIVAFFSNSSIRLHQFYVISNCSLIAVFYLRVFPGDTAWFVLWTVVFWDFFAVLAPMGPLKKVQEKAEDYSNNVLKLLMFSAEEKRETSGADKMKTGVKELIEMYSKSEKQDREFVENILQRHKELETESKQDDNENEQSDEEEESQSSDQESSHAEHACSSSSDYDQEEFNKPAQSRDFTMDELFTNEADVVHNKTPIQSIVMEQYREEKRSGNDLKTAKFAEKLIELAGDEADNQEEEEAAKTLLEEVIKAIEGHGKNEKEDYLESDSEEEEEEEESKTDDISYTAADALNDGESVRLGFGDFVFYSLLIGQAATSGSVISTFAAGVGVVLGLIATLTVLASAEHTTPALPMSVILGSFAYFYSQVFSGLFEIYFDLQ